MTKTTKQQNDLGYTAGITNCRYDATKSAAWRAGWEQGRRDMLELIDNGFAV